MNKSLRILHETRIDLHEVCRLLGTADKPVHFATAFRAMKPGALIDGVRVPLEFLKTRGKLVTSVEAVERYLAAINGIDLDDNAAEPRAPATTKQRARRVTEIDRELDAAGI
jgi:hypothetical protein